METDVLDGVGAWRAGRCLIMTPIRLAILLCDTPAPPVLKEDGDYYKIFDAWLRAASPSADFTLEAFDVVNKMEYPPEDFKHDGILLTGSGQSSLSLCHSDPSVRRLITAASAYEDVEWINKLVGYVTNLARSRPEVKLFGRSDRKLIGRSNVR